MHYLSKPLFLALGIIAVSGLADAQAFNGPRDDERPRDGGRKGPPPHARSLFDEQDTNKDGFLTKEEIIQHVEQSFGKTDSNGDGKVSLDEIHEYHRALHQAHGGDDGRRERRGRRGRDREDD